MCLLVHPSMRWLGACPDGIIFDLSENPVHGILEIKCPYKLRNMSVEELHTTTFSSAFCSDTSPELRRVHMYLFQVMGQMAISCLKWVDFVVCGKNFILIDSIRFAEAEWGETATQIDRVLFHPHVANAYSSVTSAVLT